MFFGQRAKLARIFERGSFDGSDYEELVLAIDRDFELSGWELLGIIKHDVIATTI